MNYVTRGQLADELGISTKTLYRWIKRENIILKNRLISPIEADKIKESIGYKRIKQNPKIIHPYGSQDWV